MLWLATFSAGVDGQLTGAYIGTDFELKLYDGDGSRMEPVIPVLLDARLVSMHGDKMLFRGVAQGVDGRSSYRSGR